MGGAGARMPAAAAASRAAVEPPTRRSEEGSRPVAVSSPRQKEAAALSARAKQRDDGSEPRPAAERGSWSWGCSGAGCARVATCAPRVGCLCAAVQA
eukprot:5817817-Prymnesium_polylepis.1